MPRATCPSRGDVIWLDFDPQSGHEQAGRHIANERVRRTLAQINAARGLVTPMISTPEELLDSRP